MLWAPQGPQIKSAQISAFISFINDRFDLSVNGYEALYQWSISDKENFWSSYWDFSGIVGEKGERVLLDGEDIERARWFPDARLNYAENLLQNPASDATAIYFRVEN